MLHGVACEYEEAAISLLKTVRTKYENSVHKLLLDIS
jgi:hypothetical protein